MNAIETLQTSKAEYAIVLGSGLASVVPAKSETISYSEFADLPKTSVPGHEGRFVLATIEKVPVVFAQGRVHLYEGFPLATSPRWCGFSPKPE